MTTASILPPASSTLETALERVAALMLDIIVPLRDLWSPDTCPAPLLPWLAWALSIDEWDTSWSDEQKRATVRASLSVHRHKGTIGAVREALAALGIDVRVQEWFNQVPEGEPFTFDVLIAIDQIGLDGLGLKSLADMIARTKNLRSHTGQTALTVTSGARPYVAAAAGIGSDICLTNFELPPLVISEAAIVL